MPYIREAQRLAIKDNRSPENAGELNYKISELVCDYFVENGRNYQAINDIVGALEGAKTEFQRRVVAPYEDRKIVENGDLAWPTS